MSDQKRDPDSLWTFMRTLIQTYRDCPELGWGDFQVLRQPHREVLAHRCAWQGSSAVAVHNLSPRPVTTQLELETEEPVWLDDLFAARVRRDRPSRHRGAGARGLRAPLAAGAARRSACALTA